VNPRPAAAAWAAIVLASCERADRRPTDTTIATTTATTAAASGGAVAGDSVAGRALGGVTEESVRRLVDAINGSDARLAASGAGKTTRVDVQRFARELGSAHRQRVTDRPVPLAASAGAVDALVAPLKAIDSTSAARLAALPPGAAFDSAFLDAAVRAHEQALAALDRVAPATRAVARAGDLPGIVADARAQVQRHLDEARALQRALR
jgi:predicted outer membrane protein